MDINMLFKSQIIKIDEDNNIERTGTNIIYRIINFNNMYFFAQEITTGCIFPLYCFRKNSHNNDTRQKFNSFSYISRGSYYIFSSISGSEKIFEYTLNDSAPDKRPSIEEVNAYLEKNEKNREWQKTLQSMEAENEYHCDINLIKEKIAILRETSNISIVDNDELKPKYEKYIPSIDIKEIEELGYDLSKQNNLCNLIGRDKEQKECIKTLSIRGKSVLLVGESGSGKTAIAEKLALDIKHGNNSWLEDKLIFNLVPALLVAGTKYRGEFEEKLNKYINFCKKHKGRIITFIDEMHTLRGLGATGESKIDTMNILKPYISNGDITILGCTTKTEYEEYMASDPAFAGRFKKVEVSLPDKQLNISILLSYITELENTYKIKLNLNDNQKRNVVEYITNITVPKNQRVVGDIRVNNPRISKDIIEEAFVEAIYSKKNSVNIEDICLAIISCDKFSDTFRKTKATELKEMLRSKEEKNGTLILSLTK